MNKMNFKGSAMLNPTPVVLVISKSLSHKLNIFTVGWISTVCTKKPIIAMGIRPERLSHQYIKESGQCSVNLPTRDMVGIVDYCGVVSGRKEDKIKHFNLKLNRGVSISAPSLERAPVALECKVSSITPLGTHDLFLLEILNTKINRDLLDSNNKIHFEKANLICYSHGEYYSLNSRSLGHFGYSIKKKNKVPR